MKVRFLFLASLIPFFGLAAQEVQASSLVQSHDGTNLVESIYWDSSRSELVILASSSQFMHVAVDRESLLGTQAVPLWMFVELSDLHVQVHGFGHDNRAVFHAVLTGNAQLSGVQFGIGSTFPGDEIELMTLTIQFRGPLGVLVTDPCCGAFDVNCDGVLDQSDLEELLDKLDNLDPSVDFDGNGCIGPSDYEWLFDHFDPNGPLGSCLGNPPFSISDDDPPVMIQH